LHLPTQVNRPNFYLLFESVYFKRKYPIEIQDQIENLFIKIDFVIIIRGFKLLTYFAMMRMMMVFNINLTFQNFEYSK